MGGACAFTPLTFFFVSDSEGAPHPLFIAQLWLALVRIVFLHTYVFVVVGSRLFLADLPH